MGSSSSLRAHPGNLFGSDYSYDHSTGDLNYTDAAAGEEEHAGSSRSSQTLLNRELTHMKESLYQTLKFL